MEPNLPPSKNASDANKLEFLTDGFAAGLQVGSASSLEEIRLPSDPKAEVPEVDDDDLLGSLGSFASSINVTANRREIRRMLESDDQAPPRRPPRRRSKLEKYAPTIAAFLTQRQQADQLSAFAKSVAERTEKNTLTRLLSEGAKQYILDSLNPLVSVTANVAEAGQRVNAMRNWTDLTYEARLSHVAGLAGNVAEVLSVVTPPPAGPALKLMGMGMALVKVGAESAAAEAAPPVAPPADPVRKPRPRPVQGTGRLPAPPAIEKARQPSKTGMLSDGRAKTGALSAPVPPPAQKEAPPANLKERLQRWGDALKDLNREWF